MFIIVIGNSVGSQCRTLSLLKVLERTRKFLSYSLKGNAKKLFKLNSLKGLNPKRYDEYPCQFYKGFPTNVYRASNLIVPHLIVIA